MPKPKETLSPDEQSQRFRDEVQRRIDAGELNPTEADAALDRMLAGQASRARNDRHGAHFSGTWIGSLKARDCDFGVVNLGGPPIRIDEADMKRVGTMVYHMGPRSIDLSDLRVGDHHVPPELLARFLDELKAHSIDVRDADAAGPAAEASGMAKWLKDKGLDLAQVLLAVGALFGG